MDSLLILITLGLGALLQQCQVSAQGQSLKQAIAAYPGLADILRPPTVHLRVIGGDLITIEKLGGYLVAMRYRDEFTCGGTLIEPRIVVSAAHCFLGRTVKSQWVIVGGITRQSEPGVRSQLQDYVVPAVFKEKSMHMDVAVILLAEPLPLSEKINTVSLCNQHLEEGIHLSVSGWGLLDPDSTSPAMNIRTAVVPIVNKSECRRTYKKSMKITDSMFCAGVLGNKDACTFDSGGPFIYEADDGTKELCGIVSFGISCASPKYAGVYTDVNYVKPFIMQTIELLRSQT